MGKQCHLADHMWRHASDSISILQFHVLRAQGAYWNEIVSTDEAGNSTVLRKLSREEWVRQRVRVMLGIDVFLGLAAGIVRTYRRMEGLRIRMSGTFMDEGEFEEEERLPEASIEVIDGSMFLDPETGREREIELDEDIFGGGHGGGEGEGEWEPMYGNWSPGSSDTVGRKGPQWMADTEEGEEIVLEFYDKTWRHVRGR